MSRCEGIDGQVRDPDIELVVMRRDKAAPLAIEGMAYGSAVNDKWDRNGSAGMARFPIPAIWPRDPRPPPLM